MLAMSRYRVLFGLGVGIVGLSFLAGLAGAWRWEGKLPGLDQSPLLLADRAELEGDRTGAAREWRAAALLNRRDLKATLGAAEQLARLGDFEGASELLLSVQRVAPGSPALLSALGWAFFHQQEFPQAEFNFRTALTRDPADAHALTGLGEVLLEQERYDEAVAAFRDSLEKAPGQAAVHNSLGVAYASSGRTVLAIREFEVAVRLAPNGSFDANLARARREASAGSSQ
jgi:superkiller protein 3